jgi:DnaJ-class molecular chaperone
VTAQEVKDYDSDKIDEVECPKCHGRGTYGLADDPCKLCKGDTVVTKKVRAAYINKYGEE